MQIVLIVIVAFLLLGHEGASGQMRPAARPAAPPRPPASSGFDAFLNSAASALGKFTSSLGSGSSTSSAPPPPGSFGTAADTAALDRFDDAALSSEDGLAFHDD